MLGLSHPSLWFGKFPGKRPALRGGVHLGSLRASSVLPLVVHRWYTPARTALRACTTGLVSGWS
jgi:hypothetical protein